MTLVPAHVTFRHMEPSPAAEARIQEEAANLHRYFGRILDCRVVIDAPHRHHRPGGWTFHVGIDVGFPGSRIVVNHEPSLHGAPGQGEAGQVEKRLEPQPDHKDLYVCIRDAFATVRRRLEDHARVERGDIKHHADEEEIL